MRRSSAPLVWLGAALLLLALPLAVSDADKSLASVLVTVGLLSLLAARSLRQQHRAIEIDANPTLHSRLSLAAIVAICSSGSLYNLFMLSTEGVIWHPARRGTAWIDFPSAPFSFSLWLILYSIPPLLFALYVIGLWSSAGQARQDVLRELADGGLTTPRVDPSRPALPARRYRA